jgi:DNA repair protein SbcD/Mre11
VEPIRIIQTGDFHLDSLFAGDRYTLEQGQQRRRDLRETFTAVMELARSRQAHLLLVTGDVFEHHRVSMHTMRFIRDQWAALPNLQVLVTPGNHDPAVSDSYYRLIDWSENVHIFGQGVMEQFCIQELNLVVHGFGWNTWEQKESCVQGYRVSDPDRYNILMFHGEVDGRADSPYCPVSRKEIQAAGFDAAAVGHIHQPHTLSLNGQALARYAGSPEPLDFGETGIHGILWGEVTKASEHWECVPVARREYASVRIEADCLQSQQRLQDCLSAQGIVPNPKLLLRLDAVGPYSPDDKGDVEERTAWLNSTCFYGEIRDRTYPDYDLEALLRAYDDTVLADFVQEIKRQMDQAEPADLPRMHKALQYGLAALTGRREVGL